MFLDERTSSYVRTVTDRLRGLLGKDLAGVYLIGSGAMGGFDPRSSDVDLAAVVKRSLTTGRKREVSEALSHAALPCPVRKLELVVYRATDVGGPSPGARWELNLNTGAAIGLDASLDPDHEPEHWFLLDVAMAREHALPLLGPPPQEVFGEIERGRILSALLQSLQWHRRNDRRGVESVLNACRAWRWLEENSWSPKPVAAEWARARLEDDSPVGDALTARAGQSLTLDREAVVRFVEHVQRRVEDALRRS